MIFFLWYSMMRHELRNPWFSDKNPKLFWPYWYLYLKLLCFCPGIKGFWVWFSSLPWFMYMRFYSVVLRGIPYPQVKQWMDFHSVLNWGNHSFYDWCISATQNLVLLSLCKVFLNLIPTSSLRNNFLKVKDKETEEERRNMYFQIVVNLIYLFSYSENMHIFICIFAENHVA